MISVGVLYDAQKLLRIVRTSSVTSAELLQSFRRLEVADSASVLKLAQECCWIELSESNLIILTVQGEKIHEIDSDEIRLRSQIRDVLSIISPSWAKKIADGRTEAVKIMPPSIRQIFLEAGLLADWTDDLVEWWDAIGLAARSKKQEGNMLTGRAAERLSIEYEVQRTGQAPKWTFAESNYAGYDLLSVVERDDARPCPIEVKGSTQRAKEAKFFLTRNEWETADGNPDYRLHLWIVREVQDYHRDLRVVPSQELANHIPKDAGDGRWANVAIPFAAFW